jgi:RNA polymerase sigma factor (sigma-70 family)
MHPEPLRRLIRLLCQSAEPPGGEPLGDAELLERFVAGRDQAAFELLLWRHGPMVRAVCCRLLPGSHDVDDAFQATWLVFVRKAGSIARGQAVGAWLHRVAYRVALRARAGLARRVGREQTGVEPVAVATGDDPAWHDFRQALDEEVERLPARERAAFVLCCLEGKTGGEVARQLGCPPGTVSSRLTRARQRLRDRLARRGLAPSAAALAALAGEGRAAPVPADLVHSTLKAALVFAAGKAAPGVLPGRAVALAEGVLTTMVLTRLRIAALLVLVAGLLAAGGVLTHHALTAARAGEARGAKPSAGAPDGPAVVRVAKPRPGGLERLTRQPGSVRAVEQVEVAAAVPGRLKAQAVDIGDQVKQGQLLAEIDAPLLALEEKQAAAAVQQAKGAVREAEARVATARAAAEFAESMALQREAEVKSAKATETFRQKQLARFKELLENKAVDQKLVDEKEDELAAANAQLVAAAAAVRTAKADLKVQKGKLAQAEAGLEAAQAGVDAAQVALEKAQYTRGLTRVTSPVDGVVTRRNYSIGQDVQPGGPGAGLPLLTVERIDRVRVVAAVPDRDVPLTQPGKPVDLTFDALPGVRFSGLKVARIGFVEEPETRTMRIEVDVPNPKQLLRPGMSGTVALHLGPGPADALRLPLSALVTPRSVDRANVYVVRDGKARLTPVQIGTDNGEEVEVLSGLKPDDLVVTDPNGLKGEVVPVERERE